MNARLLWIPVLLLLMSGLAWWLLKSTSHGAVVPARPDPTLQAPVSADLAPLADPGEPTVESREAAASMTADAVETAARDQHPDEDRRAELRGVVLLPGGAPAVHANVWVHGWQANQERVLEHGLPATWEDPTTTTDADGSFTLRVEPPHAFQFTLDIKLRGFAGANWRWSELAPRSLTDLGRINLRDAGVIEGRIVDASGAPCPGEWSVHGDSTLRAPGPDGDQTRVFARVEPTSATFRLEDVPVGRVELSAHSRLTNWVDGPVIVVEKGRIHEADIVYRGPDRSRSIAVSTSTRPFHIFGHGGEGTIAVIGRDGMRRVAQKIPGSSSTWSVEDLDEDTYAVVVDDPRFEPWSQTGVRPGESVSAKLTPSAAIALSVVDDGTSQPIADYRLRTQFRFPSGTSVSPDTFEVRAAGEPLPPALVYRGMMPHDQTFLVEAPGYALGEADVSGLQPGEVRAVEVRLTGAARLAGSVTRGGTALSGVAVVVGPAGLERGADPFRDEDETLARQRRATETDGQGRFEFTGLGAGSYWVEASLGPLHTAHVEGVAVEPGSPTEVRLELPPTGSLTGRLLSTEPVRFDGLRVRAWPQPGPELGWAGSIAELAPHGAVGADGSFRLDGLPPGDLVVSVVAGQPHEVRDGPMSYAASPPVRTLGRAAIRAGESTEAEFDLGGHVPCTLRVAVTVNGLPASHYNVLADEIRSNGVAKPSRLQAVTDASGRFELAPLFPGQLRLTVAPPEGDWSHTLPDPVEVAPGPPREIAVDIPLVEGEITVLEVGTSQPLAGHSIRLGPRRGGRMAIGVADSQGRVRLQLPVGTYRATDGGVAQGPHLPSDGGVTVEWTLQGPVPALIELVKAKPFEFPSND